MPIRVNVDDFSHLVDHNTLILTPNSRTQQAVIAGFMQPHLEGDVVKAPQVVPFTQWLGELWEALSFFQPLPRVVANLELKTWLFELIEKEPSWDLTNALGVAEQVLEGYRNLCLWNKTIEQLSGIETPEHQYFVRWINALEAFCAQQNLIPQFAQARYLIEQLGFIEKEIPRQILLVGFNQITPIEQAFLQQCENSGVAIHKITPSAQKAVVNRELAIDLRQELSIAATRAQQLTQQFPQSSIAVVVNQLSSHVNLVHEVFSETFQPQEILPWVELQKTGYNVSAGTGLAELPMVDAAIKLLKLSGNGIDLATLNFLKNSPFIDWGTSAGAIKRFLHEQSLLAFDNYALSYLQRTISESAEPDTLQILNDRLQSLTHCELYQRPMAAWIDYWHTHLTHWGWLTDRALDKFEAQLFEQFQAALTACLSLSYLYPKLSFSQARNYLFQMLRQQIFQIPSDRTNVQILGMLEAVGLNFDQLILVGFNQDNWPQQPKASPFIPIEFQRAHQMPGSSAEREYDYARDISCTLLGAAAQIIITEQLADEVGMSTASSFFAHFPLAEGSLADRSVDHGVDHSIDNPVDLNADNKLKLKKANPNYRWLKDQQIHMASGRIKGGAYLLSQYASCPFKAMSSFQLKLKAAQPPQKGISPAIRGAWLHLAMEYLWQQLVNQQALLSSDQQAIAALVTDCLAKAKLAFEPQLQACAANEVIEIESDKLNQQIIGWLQIEKQRQPFSVLPEVSKTLSLGSGEQMDLSFRIDRIDTLADGQIEIIDYKTGQVEPKKWFGRRPTEAQMPAYVLACRDQTISGLSYAKIKTGDIAQVGLQHIQAKPEQTGPAQNIQLFERTESDFKDKTKNLLAAKDLFDPDVSLQQQWQQSLTAIADHILAGDMPVSPKSVTESCRYCEFSDFCRIDEDQPQIDDIESKMLLTEIDR